MAKTAQAMLVRLGIACLAATPRHLLHAQAQAPLSLVHQNVLCAGELARPTKTRSDHRSWLLTYRSPCKRLANDDMRVGL